MTTEPSARLNYYDVEGLAVHTDVADRIVDSMREIDPPGVTTWQLDEIRSYEKAIADSFEPADSLVAGNPAGVSLYLAMRSITSMIPRQGSEAFDEAFGISEDDREQAQRYSFTPDPFEDTDFTVHFAVGIANAVVDSYVDRGDITQAQKDAYQLKDWADLIQSGEFRKLMHVMTFTASGVYRLFGSSVGDYEKGAVEKILRSYKGPETESILIGTHLDTGVMKNLREALKKRPDSKGCPVARKKVDVNPEDLEGDPHIKRLLESGIWSVAINGVSDDSGNEKKVRLTQNTTVIDRTLMLTADLLTRYDEKYGTPHIERDSTSGEVALVHI